MAFLDKILKVKRIIIITISRRRRRWRRRLINLLLYLFILFISILLYFIIFSSSVVVVEKWFYSSKILCLLCLLIQAFVSIMPIHLSFLLKFQCIQFRVTFDILMFQLNRRIQRSYFVHSTCINVGFSAWHLGIIVYLVTMNINF